MTDESKRAMDVEAYERDQRIKLMRETNMKRPTCPHGNIYGMCLMCYHDLVAERTSELETLQARYANMIRLVSDFVGLLPPPDVTTPDGRVFRFNAPDPHDYLRRMRDAVDRMREELQVPPAPGFNALELRKGIEHVIAGIGDGYTRSYLTRVLAGNPSA